MNAERQEPRIGIVIVTWNGFEDTAACLISLRHLTYDNYFVMVIDNGSRDGTPDLIQRYFSEVEVIRNSKNTGYVHANNQGITRALGRKADWILLLNNDVTMYPDSLTEMIKVGESRPEIGIVRTRNAAYDAP